MIDIKNTILTSLPNLQYQTKELRKSSKLLYPKHFNEAQHEIMIID